jgi:hypothetical protein
MKHPGKARTALKRGALVAAANWQVVAIQSVADTTFKLLLLVPIVGGGFLVTMLLGIDLWSVLLGRMWQMFFRISRALMAQPVALVSYLAGFLVVLVGGALLMFLVKGGSVSVIAGADVAAGPVERSPLRVAGFRRAMAFSIETFTGGASRLFRRYVGLGVALSVAYVLAAALCLLAAFGLYRLGGDSALLVGSVAALGIVLFVGLVTVINVLYLLAQLIMAVDDCGVGAGLRGVGRFLRRDFARLSRVFGFTVFLLLVATLLSVAATWGFYLIAYVPVAGVIVLPLQLGAWLLRNLVFQYVGVTALAAYVSLYRGSSNDGSVPAGGISSR